MEQPVSGSVSSPDTRDDALNANELVRKPSAPIAVRAVRTPVFGRVLKVVVALIVIYTVVHSLNHFDHSLVGRLQHLKFGWIGLALTVTLLIRLVSGYQWILAVRSLGERVPILGGVRMWLVTESLRWLPGSVWGLVSRAVQAPKLGVSPLVASLSSPLELFLGIASYGAVALACLASSGITSTLLSRLPTFWLVVSIVALIATVGTALLLTRLRPSAGIAKKIRGLEGSLRQLRTLRPRVRWLLITFGFMCLLDVFQGVAFLAVLRACSDTTPTFLAGTCINAVGWLVGFFAFFAPTGLGVREGGMAALLAPLMPLDAALVGVVLWRLIQTIAELVCLAACFVPGAASFVRRALDPKRDSGLFGARALPPKSPGEPMSGGGDTNRQL